MAHIYVNSNAAGAGTGADWTNAYTTLEAAAEAAGTAAGDNIWVAHNHAESQAVALTITFKGTAVAPSSVICASTAGSVPPVPADFATTATITTTGANAITLATTNGGSMYIRGITFSVGSGAVNSNFIVSGTGVEFIFEDCAIVKAGTTATTSVFSAPPVTLINTTVAFGSTGDRLAFGALGMVRWFDTPSAIAGATIPTQLFNQTTTNIELNGVDISAVTGTLFGGILNGKAVLTNCKLGAAVTVGVPTAHGGRIILINCDSGDTNYRTESHQYSGAQTTETTIVRTGGATDGTTPISWKLATNANSEWMTRLESLPIAIWNETLTAQTLTLYGYVNAAAVPTTAEIWIEVEYLGTSGSTRSSFVSSGADFNGTGVNYTEDTSTWGGGDTTTRFKMTATFTAAEKGYVYVRIYAAKASETFYIDPKPEISGLTVSRSSAANPGVYTNEIATAAGGGQHFGGFAG